ncbi:hypothetical protein SCALM49S_09642 [Streptomyces californicus]
MMSSTRATTPPGACRRKVARVDAVQQVRARRGAGQGAGRGEDGREFGQPLVGRGGQSARGGRREAADDLGGGRAALRALGRVALPQHALGRLGRGDAAARRRR